jgi:hypothetical protein
MDTLHGTLKNGLVVFDFPPGLPDGTRVEVVPIGGNRPTLGMREEDWPTTPEGIAALLARMDQREPGWLSAEDEADWQAALREIREIDKAKFLEDAERPRNDSE